MVNEDTIIDLQKVKRSMDVIIDLANLKRKTLTEYESCFIKNSIYDCIDTLQMIKANLKL